jgi:hypothetical protein
MLFLGAIVQLETGLQTDAFVENRWRNMSSWSTIVGGRL